MHTAKLGITPSAPPCPGAKFSGMGFRIGMSVFKFPGEPLPSPLNPRRISLWLVALALAWMAWGPARAQAGAEPTFPVFTVSPTPDGPIEVGVHAGVLVDSTGALTREQVTAPGQRWDTIHRSAPNFGFTRDTYWFRFQLDNPSPEALLRLVELPIPFIDDVQLFHYVQGTLTTRYFLGDEKPFEQRVVRHRYFVMPLKLAPGINQIYVRLASTGTMEAPFRVWEPGQFQAASNDDNLLQGAVIGILLVMVVYNLFIFISIRDINYIYYIGFVASYLFFHLTLTGYTFAYLWPNAVRWNSFAISTFVASSTLFACLFANSFLRLSRFSLRASQLMNVLALGCALLLVLTFFLPYSLTIRIGAGVTIPIAGMALVLGYWRWWSGAKFARFYCLAWTAVLIGLSVLNAGKQGWIPTNVWTENASQIGIVLLVVLLSFTLADRINHDRSLRLNAQAAALDHERKARASGQALIRATEAANRELEQRVQSRTVDLNATLEQLKIANERLQLLSTTDSLTQIRNRAFFDTTLATEYRRALRQKTTLSLILFDIDHFKKINDTYGHLGGDACLRALAATMRARIDRAGDVLARYGGEEFVVLLIDTPADKTLAMAEAFRANIEKLRVDFEGAEIRFTASLGVVCGVPDAHTQVHGYFACADKALYQAKHDGRNCVRVAELQPTIAA